ncbi:MAG: ABC transporter permease [Bdellovibrionales bacterium]|nr:ABC transporter permease [Bdellovibrionales bacterium]
MSDTPNMLKGLQNTAFGRLMEKIGDYARMIKDSAKVLVTDPPSFSSVLDELYHIGVKSFVIVAVTAMATGLVMSLQFGFGLARFGAKLYVPKIVAVSILRELGPIFTALMLAGRVGAGIASEVGSMNVTQQIDAIRALGTNPLQKIVLPKVIACVIAAPILTLFANLLGIFGGMAMSSSQLSVSAYDYFFKSFEIITGRDLTGGLFKSIIFGFIIGTIGCYVGLNTRGGTQGVGNSTTKAVVMASVGVVFADFVLTKAIWIFELAFRSGGV